MKIKLIILSILTVPILTVLFWPHSINQDDVKNCFQQRLPNAKFISAKNLDAKPNYEYWNVTFVDTDNIQKTEFWQILDGGLFFTDYKVIRMPNQHTEPNVSFWTCREKLYNDSIEYVIFGKYSLKGNKNCSPFYKLINDTLLIDTISNDFFNGLSSNNFNLIATKDQFEKAHDIKMNIPCFLLNALTKQFGRPDNDDQLGYYLEFKYKRLTHSFMLDNIKDSIPKELQLIMQTIANFQPDNH